MFERSQTGDSSDGRIVDSHDTLFEKIGNTPSSFEMASTDGSFVREKHFV